MEITANEESRESQVSESVEYYESLSKPRSESELTRLRSLTALAHKLVTLYSASNTDIVNRLYAAECSLSSPLVIVSARHRIHSYYRLWNALSPKTTSLSVSISEGDVISVTFQILLTGYEVPLNVCNTYSVNSLGYVAAHQEEWMFSESLAQLPWLGRLYNALRYGSGSVFSMMSLGLQYWPPKKSLYNLSLLRPEKKQVEVTKADRIKRGETVVTDVWNRSSELGVVKSGKAIAYEVIGAGAEVTERGWENPVASKVMRAAMYVPKKGLGGGISLLERVHSWLP